MAEETGADERLIILLEARIKDFERKFEAAERRGTNTYQKLRRGSQSATAQMESDMVRSSTRINQALATTSLKVGDFAKAFIGGFAGGAVLGAVGMFTTQLNETVKAIAAIGSEARRAGLSATAFQEWSYVATQNRINVDAVTDGFKELNLRADEWIKTGGGSAAESFQRLGFTSSELAQKLKDPSALMLEIVGRLEGMDKAAQIRIFDELLGGQGGERFVELLAQGKESLQATVDQAHQLGVVMDDEMIAKADLLDKKFTMIGETLSGLGKRFAVALAENAGLIEDVDKIMGGGDAAKGQLGEELRNVLAENGVALEKSKADVEEVKYLYQDLQRDILAASRSIGDEIPNILGSGADNAEALAIELADVTSQMDSLIAQVVSGEKPASALNAEMASLVTRAKTALEEASKIDGIHMDNAIGAVARLSGALSRAASWASGVVDKMREAANLPAIGMGMDTGTPLSGTGSSLLPPGSEGMTTGTPLTGTGSDLLPPGKKTTAGVGRASGGGGGSSRIDSVIADLQTERELTEKWYQESLDLLNGATEAQLAALGGKHEAIERLEKEHKERLAQIDQTSQESKLETILGTGELILNAMGSSNDKALKMAKAFGAAEALVSTWRAYAKALADGGLTPWQRLAWAGKILAAGMGAVNAIKGTGSGGRSTGGASGGTSSAGTQQAAPSPQSVILDFQSVDPALKAMAKLLVDPMIAQLQKASKNGVNIVGASY